MNSSAPTFKDIITSIPARFRPEKAGDWETTFHFDISGDEGGTYTVFIERQQCLLQKGFRGQPNCVVKAKAENYVKLELGELNPQMALMTGKVKVSDISEMIKFTKLFRKYTHQENSQSEVSEARKPDNGPLVGLRLLDFTRLLPGPLGTMLMADMGAEVIKVEDPDDPDYIRNFPPFVNGESVYYKSLNRSKRSLAINFKSEEGRNIIYKLAKQVDVLFEQFRPGVMKGLGLGYEDLKEINPRLIYVSITGYGQDGPYANHAGHDLNYIGYSGLLGTTGNDKQKAIPGGQIADVAAGGYMAMNGCLAALYAREKTGKGQHVDVSMMDCVMPMSTLQVAEHYGTKKDIPAGHWPLSGGLANYNVYECADGKFLALGTLEPKFWDRFCDGVGKSEWKNRILDTGEEMDQLKQEVAELIKSKSCEEWLELVGGPDSCISQVHEISDLKNDPHIQHRKMLTTGAIGIPIKFSETQPKISWDAPKLGEDTEAILDKLNFNTEDS